ncbi:MAG: sigma-54-dependent Fis family transcriptional regulator [Alphaproteobacteria bacterium]|nr:sigma-54-dependent Fis family transcriptional regulator [Alphaproteobacteria bacterium]
MTSSSKNPPRVCLIEDDEIMGESLHHLLCFEGFDVTWCRSGAEALAALAGARGFGVVVSDIRLPDRDGGDLFLELTRTHPNPPPFLFMTAYGTIDRAVALVKAGAADYVTKPFDVDVLVQRVRSLAMEYGAGDGSDDTLGVSAVMRRMAESLPRLARHAPTLLITGESGAGKEHVALLFHRHATSGAAPFVAVNCASIPETLIESELFGYERGAFTGATKTKRGYLEQANGGTLLLDEIGEMPLLMQAKLLRALQERRFVRVGGETLVPSDFRLVCATHRDIKAMVASGQFREDLYYRIDVIHMHIPPLRERLDDIRWFVRKFLGEFNRANPSEARRLDPRTEQALMSYAWPGNIRELRCAVERACILARGPLLDIEAFFGSTLDDPHDTPPTSESLAEYLMTCERDYLLLALERHDGHMTRTAEALGITRKTLWEKLRRLGLRMTQRE